MEETTATRNSFTVSCNPIDNDTPHTKCFYYVNWQYIFS